MDLFKAIDTLASAGRGSRMTPEQLAKHKDSSREANAFAVLATAANGHRVTRQDKAKARAALVTAAGSEQAADALQEAALRSAGAKTKGILGWLR
ncbi:hypothetical protein ACWENQ_45565 [Nonomuraea sp. NPDC004354]